MTNVSEWLESLDLGQHADTFEANEVGWDVLSGLDHELLKELGVAAVGQRLRILKAIETLGVPPEQSVAARQEGAREIVHSSREAERRQLTVMFADLVGSTALSQQFDPEDLQEITRGYQDVAKAAIESYGGFVARYMGDGVLAYFGYPQAHEDDAERAVRSGLRLIDGVRRLDAPVTLSVRVGIATGPVVVGDIIGEGASQESAVVGETPNLAARLQGFAEPNALVIADQTRRLSAGAFEYGDLGEHALKGLEGLVQAWEVRGESTSTSRFEALHGEAVGAFVGREHDLGMLLARWEQASGGEGQAVLVSGEAGIGKSRVTEALRTRLPGQSYTWVRHQCSPHHINSSLHPFLMQLERACDFDSSEGDEARLGKLEALLAEAGQHVGEEVLRVLAELLSIATDERFPPLTLSPQQRKAKVFEALIGQLSGLANQRPVVWVFEDAHWADPTSRELLDQLIDRLEDLPVLAVITARPEYQPAWTELGHASLLSLNRLSRNQSKALVEDLGGGRAMPAVVLEQIIARTDGVPLFVEELTKSVLESGLLVSQSNRYELVGPFRAVTIPSTLQDSLMARLDRLGDAKKVAQIAAAIGREVPRELLSRVVSAAALLEASLDELVEAGLLLRRGVPPAERLVFKHALVQDAALDSMLRRTRQSVHRRIAKVLEKDFPSVATSQPEVLAHHYTDAGDLERAIHYWHEAGTQAARRSAYRETVSHLTRALELLATLASSTDSDERELDLRTALGPAQMAVEGFGSEAVERTFTRARELCERTGRSDQLFQTLYGLFRLNLLRARYPEAKVLAEELLDHAEREDNRARKITAHRAIGNSTFFLGDVAEAQSHLLKGASLYDREADRDLALIYGDDPAVDCLIYAALAHWWLGHSDQALTLRSEALALAREISHPFSLARALGVSCMIQSCRRDWAAVATGCEELMTLSTEHEMVVWKSFAQMMLGLVHVSESDIDAGNELFDMGLECFRATGAIAPTRFMLTLIADERTRSGDVKGGFDALDAALNCDDTMAFWDAELPRIEGDLHFRNRAPDATVEASYQKAVSVSRHSGARALELRAATSLARFWSVRGQKQEAYVLLSGVYEGFTEGFDTADLQEAKALLEGLLLPS